VHLAPTTPSIDPPGNVRFAAFETVEGSKTFVATITLSKKADEATWTAQLSGASQDSVSRVQAVVARYAEKKKASEGDKATTSENPDWHPLINALEEAGFLIEELPAGDIQFTLQYDLRSGRVTATQTPLHALATPDASMARRIVASLTEAFKNAPDDLAREIDSAISSGNTAGAISSVRRAREDGRLGFPPHPELLAVLEKFDMPTLASEDHQLIREVRLAVACRLNRYDLAGQDAEALLTEENGVSLSDERKNDLQMVIALAAMKRGNTETALMIWRKLLEKPETLAVENRAWAWRNISLALGRESHEALRAAQYAADAFLEAGDKHEASQSLMQLAKQLLHIEPAEAIKKIDEILTLLDREGLTDRNLRAAALHTRANRMARFGRHQDAYDNAREAVELLRGLFGAEDQFVSSLYLAAIEADQLGLVEEANRLRGEADKLAGEIDSPHFRFGKRVEKLLESFDADEALELLREAEAGRNWEVVASVKIAQAIKDSSLNDIGRLELLEESLRRLAVAGVREDMKQITWSAIARQLLLMGQLERAEAWYRKVLEINPFDTDALQNLVHALWKRERWGDAAILLKRQVQLRGAAPGLIFAYGKSLIEAGDLSGAIPVLTKAADLAAGNEVLKRNAMELRERAIRSGAVPAPMTPAKEPVTPITRDELQVAIDDFSRFIEADKRMGFWTKQDGHDYDWIKTPEQRAQDLLHTALKAKFGDRVMVFEEISAGAGRVDLYVQVVGGMSVIIELKMCGFGYSSGYASAGEVQILHYMENRGTALGYLIVFDARLNDFKQKLLARHANDARTVIETIIDVRPRVSHRPGKQDA
jgi:tetratricopeptide (TPR) repeat protein